jgi:transposase-like protein
MSIATRCHHCGANAVRKEHIFRAEHSYTQFYCGHCNRAWAEDAGERRQTPSQEQHVSDNPRGVTETDRRKA